MTVLVDLWETVLRALPVFCFGYPFVMAWYWMAGGVIFYAVRERNIPPLDVTPPLRSWPPISILVPCYNEADVIDETLRVASRVDYPDFEIIAINDGSSDSTAAVLDSLARELDRLHVVHLVENRGKATALNAGYVLARNDILVCIDGDALLDPHALKWFAHAFRMANVGGVAGNPRIRNRSSLLGRLQIGEFSSIIGLIRRTQTLYGYMFTVSGVICAFRKSALLEAGGWSSRTATEDIDISWRIQLARWRLVFEPNAMVWMLMPETLRGLWRQRLRWAEGGAQMLVDFFWPIVTLRVPGLLPVYLNCLLAIAWAHAMLLAFAVHLLGIVGAVSTRWLPDFEILPQWWGLTLAVTYLLQALVSHSIERRYEPQMLRSLFWIIWYPLAYWFISSATAVAALPLALLRRRQLHTTWISPDRGMR